MCNKYILIFLLIFSSLASSSLASTCPEYTPKNKAYYDFSEKKTRRFLNYKNQGYIECNYLKGKEYQYQETAYRRNKDNIISLKNGRGLYECGNLSVGLGGTGIMNKKGIVVEGLDIQGSAERAKPLENKYKKKCILSKSDNWDGYWHTISEGEYYIPSSPVQWINRVEEKRFFKKIEYNF